MIGCLVFERLANCPLEMRRVLRDKVGEVAVLGMAPPRFHRIELRCIGGKPFEFDILQPRSQDLFGSRTVNTPTIQHDDQRSAETFSQGLDECHRFGRTNVVRMDLKRRADVLPLRRKGHRTDYAQPVVPIPSPLNGRFTSRSPGAPIHRLQAEARFIDKNNAGAASAGFFLIRGQSFLRHRSTASAFCSRATRRGFCGLYPRSCKMRPKWSGWYDTRNFLRTTLATRAQVHKSVLNPAATGPVLRSTSSSCFCSGDNLGVGPGCGFAANAAIPPSCHARFQRFTLERLAPTSRAVSARDFRAWKYSAARRRRASSSVALPLVLIHIHTVLAHHLVQLQRSFQ